ncbi:MAG TPA: penicillin acylase family protein [Phycisphaerae bacterium]|nr:penicillin acylase family protein [Phycisphaerae bacterium]
MTGRARRGLFAPEGELEVRQGLNGRVTILRDRLGIPYISAETWADASFAIGFCHGCDRLAQLELMRRLAGGRLAEVIGKLALPLDIASRLVGYRRLADAYEKRIDAETGDLLSAYASGVSEAMSRRAESGRLPIEYAIFNFQPQPWQLADSLAISRVGCTDINLANKPLITLVARQADEPLRRLILPLADAIDAPAAGGATSGGCWGSNAWAVAGTRTSDGMPIVAADPHVGVQAPCLWYAAQVAIEESGERLAGLTVPGWPFFVTGRNRRVAWGATNMLAETADLFWERIDGDCYVVDGERRPLVFGKETIAVRGLGTTSIPTRRTHRGTIISDSSLLRRLIGAGRDGHVSLAWPAESIPSDEVAAFYRINRAANVTEFAAALKSYGLCAMNFIAADADGHIAQFPTSALPLRNRPPQGQIYDGTTSSRDWRGVAFPSPLPSCIDPPEGFLANSNDLFTPGGRAEEVGPLTCPAYRGERLRAMLAQARGLSPQQAGEIQLDCLCRFTRALADRLKALIEEPKSDPARSAYGLLCGFDGRMAGRSPAAAVAGVCSEFFRLRLFEALLGKRTGPRFAENYHSFPATLRILESSGGSAMRPEELRRIAAGAFDETVRYLIRRHGRRPVKWQWGQVLSVAPATPLGRVPLLGRRFRIPSRSPCGSAHAVTQVRFRFSPTGKSQPAYLGVSARLVMPLGLDVILACIQTGQDENPWSEHFQDQNELLAAGRYAQITLGDLPQETAESSLVLHRSNGL